MQRQLDTLREKFEPEQEFMYEGTDLIKDVDGKNFVKWALRCALLLFTRKELKENCITFSSKTTRGHLDCVKVGLLKSKFCFK